MRTLRTRAVIATITLLLLIILSHRFWKYDHYPIIEFITEQTNAISHDKPSNSSLANRIQQFLRRPVLSYGDSVKWNSATCPDEGVNFDTGAVRRNDRQWREIPTSEILNWRSEIAEHLKIKERNHQEKVNSRSPPVGNRRGIVMGAGDRNAVIRARTNIRLLRSYNCTLPVEIFHFPSELSGNEKELLSEDSGHGKLSVTFRVVEEVQKGNGWAAFEIKGAAIQQSSFDEILYLDTDSYLLRNPEYLFETSHWTETGLLLWSDYTKSHKTNPLWRLVGQQCRNEYEGESGQLLISRSRHQDLLWLVEYFAIQHDVFYDFMGGDRDSFRAAALVLGKEWRGPGRLNAAAGVAMKDRPRGGGHTMLQADPEGRWMFVHANLIKHSRFPRPLWQTIHRAAEDRYEGSSTYGSIDPPNDKLGDGVKLHVDQEPRLVTTMVTFAGYDEALVVVEDWDAYEELRGFEEKWFEFGGEH